MSRRALPIALLIALLPGAQPPATAGAPATAVRLDLDRAVSLALERNPGLKAVEERRGEVEAAIREATAAAFPELDLVASWSRSRNPSLLNSPDFEEFIDQFPGGEFVPGEQELYRIALEVRQAVYTSGKTVAAIQLARLVAMAADAEIATARLDTAAAAAEAYYRLLAARRSLGAVEIQRRVREEALSVVEARFELGDATRLELLQARAAVAEVEPEVARIAGEVEVAAQELRAALGLPPGTPLEIGDEPSAPPPPAPSLERLLAAALAERPELTGIDLQGDALSRQGAVTRADGLPQVDLVGSYGREVRLPEDFGDDLFQDWRVALGVRWELFDGGERRAALAGLESRRRQLAWQRRDLENRIAEEIERALSGYRTARQRWRAAEAAAAAGGEAARVAAESYREGVALQADLLDAQQREILAELTRVEAYFDALTEAARLERAVGRKPGRGLGDLAGPDAEPPRRAEEGDGG